MKNDILTEHGECYITGNMPKKKNERTSPGIIIRNPLNGRIISLIKSSTNEFISKAQKIHGFKYDYSKFEYINSKTKGIIICPLHGEFLQLPGCHISQRQGCRKCGYDKTHSHNRGTTETWINKASIIHHNLYNYSNSIYKDSYTKIKIICTKHGEFMQTPDCHIQGRGCPKCKTSKGENIIREWLETKNINYEYQKTFIDCINKTTGYKLRFDFYIPNNNLLIEYDGMQHYHIIKSGKFPNPPERLEYTRRLDQIKTKYAKSRGIKFIRISYKKFTQIGKILSSVLS